MQSALGVIFGYGVLLVGLLCFGASIVQFMVFEMYNSMVYFLIAVVCVPLGVFLTGTYKRWKMVKEAQFNAQKSSAGRKNKRPKE